VGDLPRGLGAHDFGLKDLFAAAALLGQLPNIHLYTVSVEELKPMCTDLSPAVAAAVPEVVHAMHAHAARLAAQG
jgi:hydrogenase maturation protease